MALLITFTLFASAGCQRKDLLDPHEHRNLTIRAHIDDYALDQLLSQKSNGYSKPGEPRTTSYILYEKNSQKVAYSGSFDGLEGGMYVQEGIYDLLVYTTDFNEYDANFFRGMNKKETAETHTRQTPIDDVSPRSDVTEVYMVEPDPTFSVLKEEIVVFQGQENEVVEVEFVQKSFKYYLTIKAKGLQNIHTAKMNISGMYTQAYLTNEEHRMNEAGIQTVDMEITRYDPKDVLGEGEIYGEFWSFGPNAREDISNSITLYFINGDVITMKLQDLSPQIKTLTRGGEIIVTEKLEIKGPSGGFQPGVGDWDKPTDVEIIL
jgi:hypothetical protein